MDLFRLYGPADPSVAHPYSLSQGLLAGTEYAAAARSERHLHLGPACVLDQGVRLALGLLLCQLLRQRRDAQWRRGDGLQRRRRGTDAGGRLGRLLLLLLLLLRHAILPAQACSPSQHQSHTHTPHKTVSAEFTKY